MDSAETKDKFFASPEVAFQKYSDMVYRLAFVRTKSRNDSDDILQDVFLRYMKVYRNVKSEENVKALLIRITINCSKSLFTSPWFKKVQKLDENMITEDNIPDNYVLEQVLNLPLKYRTIIHLFYYGGYSITEISDMIGINPSTVKTRLSRGREALKKSIKADDL